MIVLPTVVPEALARNIVDVDGEVGVEWLRRLPLLLGEIAQLWDLEIGPPFGELSYNYVASATRADGSEAVLKVGVPSQGLHREMEAMRFFDGRAAARLLAADAERGALLLERLRPGTCLRIYAGRSQEEAAEVAAGVMVRLWRSAPPGSSIPTVGEWVATMAARAPALLISAPDFPREWIDRAIALHAQLEQTRGEPVVLHGDLHHGNLLRGGREPWLAIDGWGILGERAWEPGPFLLNALADPWDANAGDTLARCIAVFARECDLDARRVRDCGIVRSVVAAFWTLDDHGAGWEADLRCAELLAGLPD